MGENPRFFPENGIFVLLRPRERDFRFATTRGDFSLTIFTG
jgi:hypothetical protein